MTGLVLAIGYPVALAAWVALDRLTGWTFADAFGVPTK